MLRGGGGRGWWYGACTESLGSDSGDVGGDAEIDQLPPPADDDGVAAGAGEEARVAEVEPDHEEEEVAVSQEEEKRRRRGGLPLPLPPVMPRASDALVIRAERRGGRLILTQVRAAELERRGVFRASRDGGRLLLRFADDERGAAIAGAPDNDGGGEAEANEEQAGSCCGADDDGSKAAAGEVVAAAPHVGSEFCQVAAAAAGPRRVEVVGAVVRI